MSRRIHATLAWAGLWLMPLLATAQDMTVSDPHAAHAGQDHAAMDHAGMPGMDHAAMDHAGLPQAPPSTGARSPDYSDGIGHGTMPGMDMLDSQPLAMLRVDQLEIIHGRHADGQAWDVQGWYGNDSDKLWLRSEGERHRGRIDDGHVELMWNHAATAFWDTQLGVRQDIGEGPQRQWAAFGIRGLAPYWFELEATAYVGASGRTAVRFRAEYELHFTQRLILQPEGEINLYGRDDPSRHIRRGVSDTQLGLRLRYEIRRQFAPYIGVVWTHRSGTTVDVEPATDRQFVAGVRFWL